MVREIKLIGPKIDDTKLKSNKPISNQFNAPTITKINAIILVSFIIPPFYRYYVKFYKSYVITCLRFQGANYQN